MSQVGETFFTAIGCMDGRVQEAVAVFGKQKFGSMYPDTLTEAGFVAKLAKESVDSALQEALKFKLIEVSMGKHHSRGVIVHGHEECAGNPVENDKHLDHIRQSVSYIKNLTGNSIPVIGVWVKRGGQGWEAVEIPQTVMA